MFADNLEYSTVTEKCSNEFKNEVKICLHKEFSLKFASEKNLKIGLP